jgi:hypothetical protein
MIKGTHCRPITRDTREGARPVTHLVCRSINSSVSYDIHSITGLENYSNTSITGTEPVVILKPFMEEVLDRSITHMMFGLM